MHSNYQYQKLLRPNRHIFSELKSTLVNDRTFRSEFLTDSGKSSVCGRSLKHKRVRHCHTTLLQDGQVAKLNNFF